MHTHTQYVIFLIEPWGSCLLSLLRVLGNLPIYPACTWILLYNISTNIPFNQMKCPICLEGYINNETIYKLRCGHTYHIDCIFTFLTMDNLSCPICRQLVIVYWTLYCKKRRIMYNFFYYKYNYCDFVSFLFLSLFIVEFYVNCF